jgi:hypothetical protein
VRRSAPRPARRSRPEGGYALLFAVFLAATMFVLASVAAPSILNQGRRQREQELIWRGNQYVRGIRLYFQKNGRFPQNKEELLKGALDVHFVLKAYSDPVGQRAADWRFIYVAPSGQLTGSVRYHTLQEMAAALGGNAQNANLAALFGGPAQAGAASAGAASAGAAGALPAGAGRGGAAGAVAGARGGPAAGAVAAAGGPAGGSQAAGSGLTPVPLEAVDGPVFGASLIGVASKVKQNSLLVYQGKDTYFEWEFIWNPLLSRGPAGTAGTPLLPGVAPQGAQQPGAGTTTAPPGGVSGGGAGPGRMPGPGMPGMPGMPMTR